MQPGLPIMVGQEGGEISETQPELPITADKAADPDSNKTPDGKIKKYRKLPTGEKREKGPRVKRSSGDPNWWQRD
jgi:hypothetical protein